MKADDCINHLIIALVDERSNWNFVTSIFEDIPTPSDNNFNRLSQQCSGENRRSSEIDSDSTTTTSRAAAASDVFNNREKLLARVKSSGSAESWSVAGPPPIRFWEAQVKLYNRRRSKRSLSDSLGFRVYKESTFQSRRLQLYLAICSVKKLLKNFIFSVGEIPRKHKKSHKVVLSELLNKRERIEANGNCGERKAADKANKKFLEIISKTKTEKLWIVQVSLSGKWRVFQRLCCSQLSCQRRRASRISSKYLIDSRMAEVQKYRRPPRGLLPAARLRKLRKIIFRLLKANLQQVFAKFPPGGDEAKSK